MEMKEIALPCRPGNPRQGCRARFYECSLPRPPPHAANPPPWGLSSANLGFKLVKIPLGLFLFAPKTFSYYFFSGSEPSRTKFL